MERVPLVDGGDDKEEAVPKNSTDDVLTTEKLLTDEPLTEGDRERSRSQIMEGLDDEMQKMESDRGCCAKWKNTILLCIWIFLMASSNVVSQPFLITIKKDYFGTDQKAAMIQSIIQCTSAFLGIFIAPSYGKLMDSWGRRPFFLITSAGNCVVLALLYAFQHKIIVYMLASGVMSLMQSSFTLAFVSDSYSSKMRMRVFGIIAAIGNLSILIVVVAIALNDSSVCMLIGLGFSVVALIYTFFVMPETLDQSLRVPITAETLKENPLKAVAHLRKSKVVLSLCAVVSCFLVAQVGTGDVYQFYLNQRLGFTPTDNAILLIEVAIVAPICLLVVLPLLLRYFSPQLTIMIALVMLIAELILIATIWAWWAIFAIVVPVAEITNILLPVVLGLLSAAGSKKDQGRRMAGFQAIMDLMDAIGPLLFGLLYGFLPPNLSFMPFAVAAAFVVPPFLLCFKLSKYLKDEADEKSLMVA